jgi:iron complex outermembrane receptor protein
MDLKKGSEMIVEAVSAEDIGKLPDLSITDSLARLPGLTAQRLNGRSQVISVRGLSPDFTTALLNGREQVTVGDNRGIEFDQYPSEMLSSVVVYKTPDASLIGQGERFNAWGYPITGDGEAVIGGAKPYQLL